MTPGLADSWGPQQHAQIAQMRALETGRYLLRATNTGVTAIIDQKGRIVSRAPEFTTMALTGTAQGFDGTTPYARFGNFPVVVIVHRYAAVAVALRSRRICVDKICTSISFIMSLRMMNSNTTFFSRRAIYLLGFLACAGLIAFALYLQHKLGEDPCALCIFQRVAVIALGRDFSLAGLHNPHDKGNRIYAALALLMAARGRRHRARHVWLQHLPKDQVPECGPGLSYLMETQPWLQVFQNVLKGSGECAEVGWTFLRLSIPEWTLICFARVLVLAIFQFRNRRA